MKRRRLPLVLESLAILASAVGIAGNASTAADPADVSAYLGRWDLTLRAPDREYASWLEIAEQSGQLQARMVSRWGHARVLPRVEVVNGGIRFVSPKEEEGRTDTDMIFEGRLQGQSLVGTTSGPDGIAWTWRGEKAPTLKRTRVPQWGEPVTLFNGRDLHGWKESDPDEDNHWKVGDGTLISPGDGSDLVTNATFEDFKLHVEFKCATNANSGVYLRGRYEVQIEDDAAPPAPNQSTGGVYGFLAPSTPQSLEPGQWHAFDITLIGRSVTVVLDGRTIIDNKEIPGITGGALDSRESLPGPIYLQGSEPGRVEFRNIMVTPASYD